MRVQSDKGFGIKTEGNGEGGCCPLSILGGAKGNGELV